MVGGDEEKEETPVGQRPRDARFGEHNLIDLVRQQKHRGCKANGFAWYSKGWHKPAALPREYRKDCRDGVTSPPSSASSWEGCVNFTIFFELKKNRGKARHGGGGACTHDETIQQCCDEGCSEIL